MTMQQFDDFERPMTGSWVPHAIVSALTLTVLVVLLAVFMRPVERASERPFEMTTHDPADAVAAPSGTAQPRAKGSAAEMYEGLRRAEAPATPANPERITVYLVSSAAEAEALVQARRAARGTDDLPADEMVLVMGTPEEQARAEVILRELSVSLRDVDIQLVEPRTP